MATTVNIIPPPVLAVTVDLTSQAGPDLTVEISVSSALVVNMQAGAVPLLAVDITPPAVQSVEITLAAGPKGDPGEPGEPGLPGEPGTPGLNGTGKIWVDISLAAYTALSDAVRLDTAYVYNVTS